MTQKPNTRPEVDLAVSLIRCRSISPADDGAQVVIGRRLSELGFLVENVTVSGVSNLWAEYPGPTDAPLFVFAVHADVVPAGDEDHWTVDPFGGERRDGFLWGRGAVDMKSQIACAIVATERFLSQHVPRFRIGFFVSGDEETEANLGAEALLDHLEKCGQRIDCALVTEPSSTSSFGDTVKTGRRGSFHGTIVITGEQHHSSHPDQTVNSVHLSLPLLEALSAETWCCGNDFFPATSFQFTRIFADGGASNITPASLCVDFNLRFSNELSADDIAVRIAERCRKYVPGAQFTWQCNAHPFLTQPGEFSELVCDSVEAAVGRRPAYSTGGGTSDGRYLAARGISVAEFGPVGKMCHMVDERISLDDIALLVKVYGEVLERFHNAAARPFP